MEDNALIRYTNVSASRLDGLRTPDNYEVPQDISRSFTLLARYYSSPAAPSPTPITTSLLAFLDNFVTNTITPTSFLAAHSLSDIEDRLLVNTIHWARSEGIPFPAPRPSLHPVHQAQEPSIYPVHQAQGLSIQPAPQTVHRRLQIEYELPASISAIPGSPVTVLIPIQVENSSKKRKVQLQLVQPRLDLSQLVRTIEHTTRSRREAASTEASLDLPNAPDTMSGR